MNAMNEAPSDTHRPASGLHHPFWPPGLSTHQTIPQTDLWFNVEVSATRYPDKPVLYYYDTPLSYRRFRDEALLLAGHLQNVCQVQHGDRVALYLQNCPQSVIAYYAIIRAGAVVVPLNPMNLSEELALYLKDCGARVAIVGQELLPRMLPLCTSMLDHVIVATCSDYLDASTDLHVPDFVRAPRAPLPQTSADAAASATSSVEAGERHGARMHAWSDALSAAHAPRAHASSLDDLCVLPYTSGTTGQPKGCMHTHRSMQSAAIGSAQWYPGNQDGLMLSALPFFHVTGMSSGLNAPIFLGASIVTMSRWDRDVAAELIRRLKITSWLAITTMVIDFISNPRIGEFDLSSLRRISGGGAPMPAAVAQKLNALLGLDFLEGYGMSETMAGTHINPQHRPKTQCLGMPIFNVDARVIDPVSLEVLKPGETGEIVTHAPQVMQGYWKQPEATEQAFIMLDGKRFLRTGDLGRMDEEGYFFMVDRLKRMINASGYKVWPAEVEAMLYRHPAVQEACVIGARDARRGETVKALIVPRPEHAGKVSDKDIIDWAHQHMAAYKVPHLIEFTESLPKSAAGKIMWRQLQERQNGQDGVGAQAKSLGDGGQRP